MCCMDGYVQKGAEDEMLLQECSTLKRGLSRTPHGGDKSNASLRYIYCTSAPSHCAFPLCVVTGRNVIE
jgi:hypothetical protein